MSSFFVSEDVGAFIRSEDQQGMRDAIGLGSSDVVMRDDLGTPNNPPMLDGDGVLFAAVSHRSVENWNANTVTPNANELLLGTLTDGTICDVRVGHADTPGGVSLRSRWEGATLLTDAEISGTVNNYMLPRYARIYRTNPAAAVVINGINRGVSTSGLAPQWFVIVNTSSITVTLTNEASGNGGNAIYCSGGSNIVLAAYQVAIVINTGANWVAVKL